MDLMTRGFVSKNVNIKFDHNQTKVDKSESKPDEQ